MKPKGDNNDAIDDENYSSSNSSLSSDFLEAEFIELERLSIMYDDLKEFDST